MRRMLNSILLIAFIIVIILLFSPFFMGLWLQNHYQRALDRLTTSKNVQFTVLEFQRGWFDSLASVEVTIKDPRFFIQEKQPLQFKILQSIKHGPLIIDKSLDQHQIWLAKGLATLSSKDPQINLDGKILLHLNGEIENSVKLNNIAIQQTGYKVSGDKITILQANDPHRRTLYGFADIPTLSFEDDIFAKIQKGVVRWNLYYNKPLWYGDIAIVNDHLELMTKQDLNKKLSFDRLNIFLSRASQGNTTSATWRINIKDFTSPYIKLAPFTLNLTVFNMDTQAFAEFFENFRALPKGPDLLQNINKVSPAFGKLVDEGLDIKIDPLTFGSANNFAVLRAMVHIPKHISQQHLNYPFFLSDIHASLRASLNELQTQLENFYTKKINQNNQNPQQTMLNAKDLANKQIQYWLDQKMLERQGNDVVTNIVYQKGELFLNGKKTNLNPLLNELPAVQGPSTPPAQPTPSVVPSTPPKTSS